MIKQMRDQGTLYLLTAINNPTRKEEYLRQKLAENLRRRKGTLLKRFLAALLL